MRHIHGSRLAVVLGLATMLVALGSEIAFADQQAFLMGGGTATSAMVRSNWTFPPCAQVKRTGKSGFASPAAYPWFFDVSAQTQPSFGINPPTITGTPNPAPNCPAPDADPYAHITFDASIPNATTIIVNPRVFGTALAGGLGTAAVGDTTVARDSVKISVNRSGTTVTINGFVGFLRNTLGTLRPLNAQNTLILAVYPDTTTALADVNLIGTGANFYGRVVLTKTQKGDNLSASGGFNPGDFVLTTGTLQSQAVPAGGLSKVVTVPNATNATIVLAADPVVLGIGVPGSSPVGLALLSLFMLGGGAWFITMRNRRRIA